ncbi:transcriptional regulator [Rhodovulum sp. BSW8]|uniref:transcriptional regulator n=1 Tax=Rhodovulum sp. BSW8 TaxID=2259645 RepID=UPI000DE1B0FD|nr:transcriptional regulator [Rhodovulum sp. BSW8]RBO54682.1 transcriptional regulator [Rhodovulum sp. BSW8]
MNTQTAHAPTLASISTQEGGPVSLGGLTPKNLEQALQLAEILANSSIVPKDYQGKPGNVLVAIQWGMELGFSPMQAMQNIAPINGRPSLWGDAVLALVRSSGLMVAFKEWEENSDTDNPVAFCYAKRVNGEERTTSFSQEDAKKAGLAGKDGPWRNYTKRMRQMRARGFCLRDLFTDVLKGMPIAEEVRDMPTDMRDITPDAGGEGAAPATKTAAVQRKVAQKKADSTSAGPTLEAVLAAINAADDEEALKGTAADAAKITDERDRKVARTRYSERLTEFRAAQNAQDNQDRAPTLAEAITRDLNAVSGPADVEAVMGSYTNHLLELRDADPDAYDRIMQLADERESLTK